MFDHLIYSETNKHLKKLYEQFQNFCVSCKRCTLRNAFQYSICSRGYFLLRSYRDGQALMVWDIEAITQIQKAKMIECAVPWPELHQAFSSTIFRRITTSYVLYYLKRQYSKIVRINGNYKISSQFLTESYT